MDTDKKISRNKEWRIGQRIMCVVMKMVVTNLKNILVSRGIKQKWLANEAKVDPTTLSKLVRGKATPTLEVAFRIAKVLNMRIDELWFYEDDEKSPH
ncbi:helix-turn-helix transcriptional regulator [Alicyclobacillus fastidiosus]|uniref:Helix-turn-helix transcriptional regulator n=1 Tax=Alicyclobacillus fastidiosus TaxID=392011 RepID=A0ABV5AKS2_9BACL|nr:helix-turn-helix transcriptional regulator [Alicyclobacillus fastidiosus]WEH10989.1 helix-turn-helix transcriptional regulator [Alicyclobacillus fastidiosus]